MDKQFTRTTILYTTPEDVWDSLTNPRKTKLYMFNCEVRSDWKIGSDIKWKGNFEGYESGEKGIILEIKENVLLKYSSFDPNFGLEDRPENYLHVTYSLKEWDGRTELNAKIENFNQDPERIGTIAKMWDDIVLPGIKKIHQAE